MSKRKRVQFIAALVFVSALIFSAALLATNRKDTVTQGNAIAAVGVAVSATPPYVPPPVSSFIAPTNTVGTPYVPPTQPPYPPPPPTIPLTPGTPNPTIPVTAISHPAASTTAIAGPRNAPASTTTIAWGAEEASGELTIWIGNYSDNPTPSVTNARAVAKWKTDSALKLLDLAFSPDGQSLAVLSTQVIEGEGLPPTWLSAIDLNTDAVQDMPDYSHYDLYQKYLEQHVDRILGWLDSNRLAVLEGTVPIRAAIAGKDGASYAEVPYPPQPISFSETALSPDRSTFFSFGEGGLWLYGVDGSKPHNVVGAEQAKDGYFPVWSPDSTYISFSAPKDIVQDGNRLTDGHHTGVWLLNLGIGSQQLVSGEDAWNALPTWSPDSSKLAFLRADAPVTDEDNIWYNQPQQVNTNIFIANISDLVPHQLTSFMGVRNSNLQWTQSGNIVLSSSASSTSGTRSIVSVSAATGIAQILVNSATDQSLVHPIIFTGGPLPGMPKTGK